MISRGTLRWSFHFSWLQHEPEAWGGTVGLYRGAAETVVEARVDVGALSSLHTPGICSSSFVEYFVDPMDTSTVPIRAAIFIHILLLVLTSMTSNAS